VSGENSGKGDWLLGGMALLFIVIGLLHVILWLSPDLIAVEKGADALAAAPDFITNEAEAFVGIVLAGSAALAAAPKA
jgi:hypothetical protein